MPKCLHLSLVFTLVAWPAAHGQRLQEQLARESPAALAADTRLRGDAGRGAVLFYQPYMACRSCHAPGGGQQSLGPDLTKLPRDVTDDQLVESVLEPSKQIREGYETITLVTADGRQLTGLLERRDAEQIVLRDAARRGALVEMDIDQIEELDHSAQSIMPSGQVNVLASRQQFLDLLRYLIEIRDGGVERYYELEPPPALYTALELPAYEQDIDHAGMIQSLDSDSFRRGETIYKRLCVNCHGTHQQPGSLPTSLRFASGRFKNGSDPYTMYQTLTRGFGMMVAQTWMVPQQKYDVIHYIRQAYLKADNPTQYFAVNAEYLERLPQGTSHGPEPSSIEPWKQMDYGPNLVATYEIGSDGSNFAYKGNAIRLDGGPGGVAQGRHWTIFDYDTLRMAAVYSGEEFIDYRGINFDGQHAVHPRIAGSVQFANPTGPGWAHPADGSFEDTRLRGRDGRAYGPLARDWAHLLGTYAHGPDTVFAYTVGETEVLEMPGLLRSDDTAIFSRTLNIGPRTRDMVLQVAHRQGQSSMQFMETPSDSVVLLAAKPSVEDSGATPAAVRFDGQTHIEVANPDDLDLHDEDFTVVARIKTTEGGTIFAKTAPSGPWVRDGKTLFVREGRLAYDIGWVGVVESRRKVNDGRWHDVALTYVARTGTVRLYIDSQLDTTGRLKPRRHVQGHVVRIGYTASDFPEGQSQFVGEIASIHFFQDALDASAIVAMRQRDTASDAAPVAHWSFDSSDGGVPDLTGNGHDGHVVVGDSGKLTQPEGVLVAGLIGDRGGARWILADGQNLRLAIPAGNEPLKFSIWHTNVRDGAQAQQIAQSIILADDDLHLSHKTRGGPPRWPETLTTPAELGDDDGPFAVDVLRLPTNNPWFCRMRLSGIDFFPDGDRAAICSWDGSVWLVAGLSGLPETTTAAGDAPPELTWRRIASGLFQPLGLKIVDGQIFVTCRDQLCVLHDLNGDGETDYYENFNNDHQVTDHFHEFAMGLQRDAKGNFYYAKSARHALKALVPHHGTLLRISPDGRRTDIVATGFRAANGVCLNLDGTFIVTDQEGHWNPKNRINWVREGGFYGNMFGYHDVTDSADSAMEQPLCWITNSFDRSPAELLWVESDVWGPLNGSLLNLSYGYGKVYVVPHESLAGQMQGGMCELPISSFPTGVMRGRFHPRDGQLYVCGMFAWAGNAQQPGGLYRIRYTGKPVHLPVTLSARRDGMLVGFSGKLDRGAATNPANYLVKVWTLKRTAQYGSDHYDERQLDVTGVSLADDGQTVRLQIADFAPSWCMEIKYRLSTEGGQPLHGIIHNTVHHLAEAGTLSRPSAAGR